MREFQSGPYPDSDGRTLNISFLINFLFVMGLQTGSSILKMYNINIDQDLGRYHVFLYRKTL